MRLRRLASPLLLAAGAIALALCLLPGTAEAQCTGDADCRYGRTCIDGRCSYPEGACQRDVDCPDGAICEAGRCTRPAVPQDETTAESEPLLPRPQPIALRGLRARRSDGGERFVDPIDWGGRGAISPRPRGTSIFDFQYGSGEVPCPCARGCLEGDDPRNIHSMQLTLGGDSVVANIVNVGFNMALFRWSSAEGCEADDYTIGDIQMRLAVLAYRNAGSNHWFGLTPFVRLLLSVGGGLVVPGTGYSALIEPGVALGFARGMLSVSSSLSGIIGVMMDETMGMFLSHLSLGIRPIPLLAVVADLEVGYGIPGNADAVPVAILAGLRLFLGRMIVLDLSTRVAATEPARYSDANAAAGLWSLGLRLSVVWRGMGRP